MNSPIRRGLALFLLTVLVGCAVGPNFNRPALPSPTAGYGIGETAGKTASASPRIAGSAAQALRPGTDLPGDWWTLFHNVRLDALVSSALRANPDIDAARASLRAARSEVRAQRAGLFPAIGFSAQSSREKDSATLSPTLNDPIPVFNLNTAQVTVSYSPDVFGSVRRGVENAAALAEQQRFELEASYLTITTNVVNAAIQEAGLIAQLDALGRLATIQQHLLSVYRKEQQFGQTTAADVAAQEAALAQAQAQTAPLRSQLAQQQDLLAALTGTTPTEFREVPFQLRDLALPGSLPVSLPSALINQRPDVRAAEANVHAMSAAVGIAVAARLPSFPLTATGGGASTKIADLVTPPNTLWSLVAGITQPVFQGGQLLARQREAEANLDQAKAEYRSTVLKAFQNVADTLHAIDVDAQTLQAVAKAEAADDHALLIAQEQQRLGQISTAQVFVVEENYRTALQAEAQAQAARYSDTVALFQALGGGWWHRDDR